MTTCEPRCSCDEKNTKLVAARDNRSREPRSCTVLVNSVAHGNSLSRRPRPVICILRSGLSSLVSYPASSTSMRAAAEKPKLKVIGCLRSLRPFQWRCALRVRYTIYVWSLSMTPFDNLPDKGCGAFNFYTREKGNLISIEKTKKQKQKKNKFSSFTRNKETQGRDMNLHSFMFEETSFRAVAAGGNLS